MLNIKKIDLEDLYLNKRMTDKSISVLLNCEEHTIQRLRKKYGIKVLNRSIEKRSLLNSLSNDRLIEIVMTNNYAGIQKALGVSCVVWKEELKNRGIDLKAQLRIDQYPDLTPEQHTLLIGSLLGDGGIEGGGQICARYFESHAPNQYLYLKKKHIILKPFSCDIYVDKAYRDLFCYRFTTVSHPHFKKLRDVFYDPSLEGKLIPLEYIKSFWSDDILVYWFLDDGHYDKKSGCYTIANKCPKPDQLFAFLDFLSEYYQVPFTYYTEPDLFSVKIPLKFKDRFIKMILKVATEDMLYKVPAVYQRERKEIFKQYSFNGSSRIDDIKNKILLGYTLEDLKEEYPITEALFLRLGGNIPKYITINHPIINEIVGDGQKPDICAPLDLDAVIGTIMGDGNIFRYGDDTCIFSFAHSVPQVSYIKLKYEFLKSYVNRIRYVKNTTNDFYSFHVILKTLPIFFDYYKMFYTVEKESKKNLQKYLFRKEIIDLMTLKSFAFWLMDDGKKYGSGKYMFTITIAKQPYYNYKDFQEFVGNLNDKLGIDMRAREEKISYEITTTPGTVEKVFDKIKDHIWPYFSYKFGVTVLDCGQIYKNLSWFSEWEGKDAYVCNLLH